MMLTKKFIAPGAWFSLLYPESWNEFEDAEGTFLFYNPNSWTGNFRVSAFRGEKDKKSGDTYGQATLKQVLNDNPSAKKTTVAGFPGASGKEMFMEDETYYTTHWWLIDAGDLVIECSFTVQKGGDVAEAEAVIKTIEVRDENKKYPAELIPVRLSEIFTINESYEWMTDTIKNHLKQDFQGSDEDLAKMQQIVDDGLIGPKKRDLWLALGITLCVIIANEVDGVEWMTLVDGNREAPVIRFKDGRVVDPMKLIWSKVKAGEKCNIEQAYHEALNN